LRSFVTKYVLDRENREAVEDYMNYLDGLGYWPGVIHRTLKTARRNKDQTDYVTTIQEPITIHLV
jgi:hypothetical protein